MLRCFIYYFFAEIGQKPACFDEFPFPSCQKNFDECSLACMKKHYEGTLLNVFCEGDVLCVCRYAC